MTDKLFDCVFIARDSKNVNKVRFANDYDKRKLVLERDKFTITYSDKFDSKLTKEQILEHIDENELSEDDFVAYQNMLKSINKSKTEVKDVLAAILNRKTDNTETQTVD